MKNFNKIKQLKSTKIITTDKASTLKGGGGIGCGNGYPPPFGEEGATLGSLLESIWNSLFGNDND